MFTLKRISTNLIGITNDVLTVGAKVVVDSVRVVTDPQTCWPFHQGMRAYALQPVPLQAARPRANRMYAREAYSHPSNERFRRSHWGLAGWSLEMGRGVVPIAAR